MVDIGRRKTIKGERNEGDKREKRSEGGEGRGEKIKGERIEGDKEN